MDHAGYSKITDDLRQQMAERLSIRARSFPRAVRKAGRLLPPQARVAAQDLIALDARLSHPKLATRTDPQQVHMAVQRFETALSRFKPGARAAQQRSLLAAEIGFRALVVISVGLLVLQWQIPA